MVGDGGKRRTISMYMCFDASKKSCKIPYRGTIIEETVSMHVKKKELFKAPHKVNYSTANPSELFKKRATPNCTVEDVSGEKLIYCIVSVTKYRWQY